MERAKVFEGQKFMWDGVEYGNEKDLSEKRSLYEKEGFSVQALSHEGKFFLFTRRIVKETTPSPAT